MTQNPYDAPETTETTATRQAKYEHESGNYEEAMYRMRRLHFYCNLAITLVYGPLLLFALMAAYLTLTRG